MATETGLDESAFSTRVDTERYGPEQEKLCVHLRSRVVGQERAARQLSDATSLHDAGLQDPDKPRSVKLFIGSTGVGKTEMSEQYAWYVIGGSADGRPPLTRIDCGMMQESHKPAAMLLGSAAGYVGYNDIPLLAQQHIDDPHFQLLAQEFIDKRWPGKKPKDLEEFVTQLYDRLRGSCRSVVLFDELEKAHPNLWNILLPILDRANTTCGNGQPTSFLNTDIIMTSNVNGRELQKMLTGDGTIGFRDAIAPALDATLARLKAEKIDDAMYKQTLKAIKRLFSPEFVGRIKADVVVFRPLDRTDCMKILDLQLAAVQRMVDGTNPKSVPLILRYTDGFKAYLLDEGVGVEYGVRELKYVVRNNVRRLLAKAINSGELRAGDLVLFTMADGKPELRRAARTAQQTALAIRPTPTLPVGDDDVYPKK